MNENKTLKIFCCIGFLAFAAVSCWATAESLHLLLSSWPLIFCYVVTIGFFFIASWGTKMIVDSCNQNIYLERRGLRFVGGIVILLIFWLVCSMPTNTHTFLYRSIINDKVTNDITTTKGYLDQIKSNQVTDDAIKERKVELSKAVHSKLRELESEIQNEVNPGFGPKSKEILRQLASLLGVATIEPLSNNGCSSRQDRIKLCDEYRKKIIGLLDSRLNTIEMEMTPSNDNYKKKAEIVYNNLSLVEKYIDEETIDLNDAKDIKKVCDKLNDGYATIKNYQQFVVFKDETEKAAYTAQNPVTKVKRMISVYDVWMDFFKGEYAGHGFIFWILISILVDVAAFIFFDIAFKRRD